MDAKNVYWAGLILVDGLHHSQYGQRPLKPENPLKYPEIDLPLKKTLKAAVISKSAISVILSNS